MRGHIKLFNDAPKTYDRTRITSLHKLYPKDHEPYMWIRPAHIPNQLDFLVYAGSDDDEVGVSGHEEP